MVNKDMLVGQVLREHPETAEVFRALGMHCLGCPSSVMESVKDAAITHGKDPDALVEELNAAINKSK